MDWRNPTLRLLPQRFCLPCASCKQQDSPALGVLHLLFFLTYAEIIPQLVGKQIRLVESVTVARLAIL